MTRHEDRKEVQLRCADQQMFKQKKILARVKISGRYWNLFFYIFPQNILFGRPMYRARLLYHPGVCLSVCPGQPWTVAKRRGGSRLFLAQTSTSRNAIWY